MKYICKKVKIGLFISSMGIPLLSFISVDVHEAFFGY
jgi:hypothetical protein